MSAVVQSKKKRWQFSVEQDFVRNKKLSLQARMLYILLMSYASPDSPRPFPCIATVAEILGLTPTTVVKYRRELEQAGWVETEKRKDRFNRFKSYVYTLLDGPASIVKFSTMEKLTNKILPRERKNTGDGVAQDSPDLCDPPVTKFSPAVVRYSKFSRLRGYHVRTKLQNDRVIYMKGGQPGGWSRETLVWWEKCWKEFLRRNHADEVESVMAFYLEHYDSEFAPDAHTLPQFIKKFEKIKKFVKREKKIRERNGEESEEAPIGITVVDTGTRRHR